MNRLRWFWSLTNDQKMQYIAKTIEDMDAKLYKHDEFPDDWIGQNEMDYKEFLNEITSMLRKLGQD